MKKLLCCCFWLVTYTAFSAPTPTLLTDALTRKQVILKPTAHGLGEMNLTCVLQNTSPQEIEVHVPPGLHFKSANDGAQDLLTIMPQVVVLAPHAEKTFLLTGYCMQASRYAPGPGAAFVFKGYAAPPLRTLADSLSRYPPLAASYAQMFVWAITNKRLMYDFEVDKKYVRPATNIMNFVARAGNVPAVKVSAYSAVTLKNAKLIGNSLPPASVNVFSKRAILVFHNPTNQVASFKIFDDKGNVKHVFFEHKKINHGLTEYTFGINDIIRTNTAPVYYAKVISNTGKVLAQMKVDKQTEEQKINPLTENFTLRFELKQGLKKADLNIYLEDGTLVENFKRYEYLPVGHYNLHVTLKHLFPPGTKFITRLQDASGTVYAQLPANNK